jgi:hypothetical protein
MRNWPHRAEIIGSHPHAGAIGTADPLAPQIAGMTLVIFEESHLGEDACYAAPENFRELAEGGSDDE